MSTWLACVSLLASPLLTAAAPQAQWLTCDTHPDNFVNLEKSSEDWPVGKVVVLEGFVGSVQQDAHSTQFSVQVRSMRRLSTAVQLRVPASRITSTFTGFCIMCEPGCFRMAHHTAGQKQVKLLTQCSTLKACSRQLLISQRIDRRLPRNLKCTPYKCNLAAQLPEKRYICLCDELKGPCS